MDKKPPLAPIDTFQRVLYALIAVFGPWPIIGMYYRQGTEFGWIILLGWWIITLFYTIDWAISSYRKFRNGNLPNGR